MDIVGHSSQIKVLKKLADTRALAHGYLFFGPQGSEKRTVAESLAHYLEGGAFAPAARVLNDSRMFRPDEEGKIGIGAARELKLFLYARPNVSAYRLAVVVDAHRLTPEAQNALLKIAEEPPASGVLVLITPDREALFPTLRSRVHQLYFPPPPPSKERLDMAHTQLLYREAEQFFKIAPAARKEYVKKFIAPLDFSFPDFLDQCIIVVGEAIQRGKGNYALWHKLLALRGDAARGSLNARIQLLALTES
jgi:DNA polymerase III delta prime subunit